MDGIFQASYKNRYSLTYTAKKSKLIILLIFHPIGFTYFPYYTLFPPQKQLQFVTLNAATPQRIPERIQASQSDLLE